MKVVYRADDGAEFESKGDCLIYEFKWNHRELEYVTILDVHGEELRDYMSTLTYCEADEIIVPTDECAKQLRELGEFAGFDFYKDITSSGIWEFNEDGNDEKFVKTGEYKE